MSVKTQKMIIGACLAFLVVFWGYKFMAGGSEEVEIIDGTEQSGETISPTDQAGQEILTLVKRLEGISINQGLFSDASFRSLVDFTVNIFPEATGRPNPFAAIGSDNTSFVSQTTLPSTVPGGTR